MSTSSGVILGSLCHLPDRFDSLEPAAVRSLDCHPAKAR
jgi:hypothetical protein